MRIRDGTKKQFGTEYLSSEHICMKEIAFPTSQTGRKVVSGTILRWNLPICTWSLRGVFPSLGRIRVAPTPQAQILWTFGWIFIWHISGCFQETFLFWKTVMMKWFRNKEKNFDLKVFGAPHPHYRGNEIPLTNCSDAMLVSSPFLTGSIYVNSRIMVY